MKTLRNILSLFVLIVIASACEKQEYVLTDSNSVSTETAIDTVTKAVSVVEVTEVTSPAMNSFGNTGGQEDEMANGHDDE